MYYISATDIQIYINEFTPRLNYLKTNYANLTYIQIREYNSLNYKIKLFEAYCWLDTNKGNIRGFLDRLPNGKEKMSLLKSYNRYNNELYYNKLPSAFTELIPGLNANYTSNTLEHVLEDI